MIWFQWVLRLTQSSNLSKECQFLPTEKNVQIAEKKKKQVAYSPFNFLTEIRDSSFPC
jgi:hypothetical protein